MKRIKSNRTWILLISAVILVWATDAYAGPLSPSAPPAPTMMTLSDLYAAITSPDFTSIVFKDFAQGADGREVIALRIGEYPGSGFTEEGFENACRVVDVEQRLTLPYNPSTGLPNGQRQHGPINLIKTIDKATPGLHKALCTSQHLRTVTITFYMRDPATASTEPYYRITLHNVYVVEIGPTTNIANGTYKHMERISLIYDEIEWNYLIDSIVENDRLN